MTSKTPTISVCMPVYNAAPYLKECIDSILAQTYKDFELLIVDDGSTDGSVDIVRSYCDPRIRLILNEHDYISSLNLLLDEARGKYIARMDADDVMMPYRLQAQFGHMEKHTEIGVLGGGIQKFGKQSGIMTPHHKVTMQDMINACCIAHPSVMIRASIFKQYGLCYEEKFKYAEDYRLWMQMMKHEIIFRNLPTPIIKYRISENQITSRHLTEVFEKTNRIRKDGAKWLIKRIEKVSYEDISIPLSTNQLTIVIPFLNEKEEVGHTVRSIRSTAGNNVDIIVINDHSDDNYNYQADLVNLNVTYIFNSYRIGAAASKEKGARLARTPYFLLLDAHMRCFTPGWHTIIVSELKKNDRQILCCQTKALGKERNHIVFEKKSVTTDGAYILFDYNNYIPGIHWNEYRRHGRLPGNKIACILGAGYAASKRYWTHIKGLEGLMHYGSEETYVSLKAWLEGGGCSLLPNVVFGHIYRAAPPYRIVTAQMHYNLFIISSTLFPTSLQCWSNAIAYKIDKSIYEDIKFWLSINKKSLKQLKQYYTQICHEDFEKILDINDIVETEKLTMANHEKKRLPLLLNFIKECAQTSCIDLWDGCMGLLIVLCEYAEYMQSNEHITLAMELLEHILENIRPQSELPISFSHGICGIGWGLIYMMRNNLSDIDYSEKLNIIDEKIMERDPERITDYSFQSGIGGILCYVTHRLSILLEGKNDITFDTRYLSKLRKAARKALSKSTDVRTQSYALLLLEFGKEEWHVLRPKWKDIIELPTFLPLDYSKWDKGLTGAVGYLCNLTQALRSSIHKIELGA
ncbi:MAG: glycosyltransferase [Paraprevotella sp.]|nr:glycosyltransferase [Paraprevotella sp.]